MSRLYAVPIEEREATDAEFEATGNVPAARLATLLLYWDSGDYSALTEPSKAELLSIGRELRAGRGARSLPQQGDAPHDEELLLDTQQVTRLARSVELAPAVAPILGSLLSLDVDPLVLLRAPANLGGWLLTWTYSKPSCRAAEDFAYSVSAFIPVGQRAGRCLEVILAAYQRFFDHELREGFLVGKERPFDPHSRLRERGE